MNDTIQTQYSTGLSRNNIEQALISAGKDLAHLAPADLGLVEDFHTMGRYATAQLVDLAQIFGLTPVADGEDRLPKERFDFVYKQLSEIGIRVCQDCDSMTRLKEMRQLYEGYAKALSEYLYMPLPPWSTDHPRKDNWQSVARVRAQSFAAKRISTRMTISKTASRLPPWKPSSSRKCSKLSTGSQPNIRSSASCRISMSNAGCRTMRFRPSRRSGRKS